MFREQATVHSAVTKLGDFIIGDSVVDSTTHVVCGGNRRTIKVLVGIARGCWIVSLNWVNQYFCTHHHATLISTLLAPLVPFIQECHVH